MLEADLSDLSLCYSRNPDPRSQASGREETSTKHCLRVALGCSQQTSACSSWGWTNFLDKRPWGPKGQIEGPGRKDRRLLGLKEGTFGEEVGRLWGDFWIIPASVPLTTHPSVVAMLTCPHTLWFLWPRTCQTVRSQLQPFPLVSLSLSLPLKDAALVRAHALP